MYEFGPFRLDAAKRRLWRDDDLVPLTPKAFDTLAALIERAGTVVFTIAPPEGTRFSTSGAFMAASPDGTHIAFLASRPESPDRIWIRPMTSATARELVGTDGATQLFWSPDSRFVAFFSDGKL